MDTDRLRTMAEQIARNFAVQGEAAAIAATAQHLKDFWDPRMKSAILAENPATLSPIVRGAIALLRG